MPRSRNRETIRARVVRVYEVPHYLVRTGLWDTDYGQKTWHMEVYDTEYRTLRGTVPKRMTVAPGNWIQFDAEVVRRGDSLRYLRPTKMQRIEIKGDAINV